MLNLHTPVVEIGVLSTSPKAHTTHGPLRMCPHVKGYTSIECKSAHNAYMSHILTRTNTHTHQSARVKTRTKELEFN